ncbi:MAG: putative zinc-binding metallopeptidase [Pseudomonadota bacterium]
MRQFFCDCGAQVFFENDFCINCNSALGYDPTLMDMVTLAEWGDGRYRDIRGQEYRYCENGREHRVCNWLVLAEDEADLCFACDFNRTVPNQSRPENQRRWLVLERAKKRLFYTLQLLSLPLVSGWKNSAKGLLFDFIEDARSTDQVPETFVSTGYGGGVITINALEADEVARAAAADELHESYRTVLGHLRHESGHYYWAYLDPSSELRKQFRQVFGEESSDYGSALAQHYRCGPPENWHEEFISAYASAHPSEDWAECWAHYLHIYDALETAWAHQLLPDPPWEMSLSGRLAAWSRVSLTLNELNRSVGRGDAYPFVINDAVAEKFDFIETVMARLRIQR